MRVQAAKVIQALRQTTPLVVFFDVLMNKQSHRKREKNSVVWDRRTMKAQARLSTLTTYPPPQQYSVLHRCITQQVLCELLRFSPLWLGDDRVHYGAWRRVGKLASHLSKHTAIDPLLHHNHAKLGTEEMKSEIMNLIWNRQAIQPLLHVLVNSWLTCSQSVP